MPKIYNLSIILFVLGLYTLVWGCSDINIFKDKIKKNTTTWILVDSENNLSDSNLSGEIVSWWVSKQFKYCTLDLDECIRNNQRTTTWNPWFAPITLSGFIFSWNTITQPRYEDAPVGNNVSTIFFINYSLYLLK